MQRQKSLRTVSWPWERTRRLWPRNWMMILRLLLLRRPKPQRRRRPLSRLQRRILRPALSRKLHNPMLRPARLVKD